MRQFVTGKAKIVPGSRVGKKMLLVHLLWICRTDSNLILRMYVSWWDEMIRSVCVSRKASLCRSRPVPSGNRVVLPALMSV